MIMRPGESWHCTDRSCNTFILVEAEAGERGSESALFVRPP